MVLHLNCFKLSLIIHQMDQPMDHTQEISNNMRLSPPKTSSESYLNDNCPLGKLSKPSRTPDRPTSTMGSPNASGAPIKTRASRRTYTVEVGPNQCNSFS